MTAEQRLFLHEIIPILQPFKEILIECQREKFVSISNGYYYLKIAHTQLDNIQVYNIFFNILSVSFLSLATKVLLLLQII